ncbi:Pyrophosphate--fructose 6-phosphate 1-phosphotransferase subunit beta 2, partial [Durusdinium trenchii]
MGNAPPISEQKLKELRKKYDKDGELARGYAWHEDNNGLEWEEFKALAVEVGELQGLKKPAESDVDDRCFDALDVKTIFLGLDEDKTLSCQQWMWSGVVSIQEFEAAYAKLEEQLQAAAKAKAKSKAKAKADAKPKAAKAKAKAKAAEVTLAEGQTSIFDAMPGFNSFVRDLGISSLFEEDSR